MYHGLDMENQTRDQQVSSCHTKLVRPVRTSTIQYRSRTIGSLIAYHMYSIWLFTFSDLKTIVGPSTSFAVMNYLGCSAFGIERPQRTGLEHVGQLFQVIFWLWINLLPFNIDNQRHSIDEDLENKPWRTLPSRRMTAEQATAVMFALYPIAIVFGFLVGSHFQSLALVGLGIWYNDLKGADNSWIVRNFINACGFICFATGALQIMLRDSPRVGVGTLANPMATIVFTNPKLGCWLLIIGNIVLSTIQIQDMHDQVGDQRHGRKSMPLVLGDQMTRWTIATATLFWSWICPWFWSLPYAGFAGPMILGTAIARRTLSNRSIAGDKLTFRIWNAWLVTLYGLPMTYTWLT